MTEVKVLASGIRMRREMRVSLVYRCVLGSQTQIFN